MLKITDQSRILIGTDPVDFRKGLDGFVALCAQQSKTSPRDGTLFVFRNRAKTMVRALVYDGNGYWLATKRLSSGRFAHWPCSREPLCLGSARQILELLKTLPSDSCKPMKPLSNETDNQTHLSHAASYW